MSGFILLYSPIQPRSWTKITLVEGLFSIGRTHDNNLVLGGDTLASRKHAVLRIEEAAVWIKDLNSSNGVTIAGEAIPPDIWVPVPLDQDIIIGVTVLQVQAISPEPVFQAANEDSDATVFTPPTSLPAQPAPPVHPAPPLAPQPVQRAVPVQSGPGFPASSPPAASADQPVPAPAGLNRESVRPRLLIAGVGGVVLCLCIGLVAIGLIFLVP